MKKKIILLFGLVLLMSSFAMHKFYVSIYQINYVPEKKTIQITSRIFVDDLNTVLSEKYSTKMFLGEKEESANDMALLQKYVSENLIIKINGKPKVPHFANKEMEGNVLICYFTIKEIPKIKSVEIQNTMLLALNDEQQNIVHTHFFGNKKSFLFTTSNVKGMLKY